jgi:hypothetical protein
LSFWLRVRKKFPKKEKYSKKEKFEDGGNRGKSWVS